MKRFLKNILMIIMIALLCLASYYTMNYAKNHLISSNTSVETPPSMPSDTSSSSSEEPPAKPDSDTTDAQAPSNMTNGETQSNSLTVTYYLAFAIIALVTSLVLMYLIMSLFNKKTIIETFLNKDKIVIYILLTIIIASILTYGEVLITNNYFLTTSSNNNTNFNTNNSATATYISATEITKDTEITSGSYESTSSDSNAILVNGSNSILSNIVVNKTGDSDGGDNTSFYGTNSGILAKSGAYLILKNITVTTSATGANGVFCYGGSATTNNSSNDGTTIEISDSTITTTKDNSGGIMTTGGGTMKATNLTINTAGTSSAAIRSDRGGGTVTVDKGTYTTTGQGSPTIYSTADITVSNAKLIADASEGVVIEGKNSVTLDSVTLTDTNNKLNGQSTTYKNIFLYQSMSGDASTGSATFTSSNSNIITNKGDTFYITNTSAVINLTNNTFTNNDSTGNFLRAQKDSWGTSGSNGGDVTLNMTNQEVTGNIVIDAISTLIMNTSSNSYYEGTINGDNTAKSIALKLDSTSKIKLTGDSYITSLDNADSTNSNIDLNGYTLYVNGVALK